MCDCIIGKVYLLVSERDARARVVVVVIVCAIWETTAVG